MRPLVPLVLIFTGCGGEIVSNALPLGDETDAAFAAVDGAHRHHHDSGFTDGSTLQDGAIETPTYDFAQAPPVDAAIPLPHNDAALPHADAGTCNGISCGPNAHCLADPLYGYACECAPGYYDTADLVFMNGAKSPVPCKAGTPCGPNPCNGHGECTTRDATSYGCDCDPGYVEDQGTCVLLRKEGCYEPGQQYYTVAGTRRCDATDKFIEGCVDLDGDGLYEWTKVGDCNNVVANPADTCSNGCLITICSGGFPVLPGVTPQDCGQGLVCTRHIHDGCRTGTEPDCLSPPSDEQWECNAECDCSNCVPMSFNGAFSAACVDKSGKPAVCNRPCPNGFGCLPFQTQRCFNGPPAEGYVSAPPI